MWRSTNTKPKTGALRYPSDLAGVTGFKALPYWLPLEGQSRRPC